MGPFSRAQSIINQFTKITYYYRLNYLASSPSLVSFFTKLITMEYADDFDIAPQADIADLPNFRMHENVAEFDDQDDASPIEDPSAQYFLPDVIKQFIVFFQRHVAEKNVYEIHSIYENSFNKLTERYAGSRCSQPFSLSSDVYNRFFKTAPWPPVEAFGELIEEGQRSASLVRATLVIFHLGLSGRCLLQGRFFRACTRSSTTGTSTPSCSHLWMTDSSPGRTTATFSTHCWVSAMFIYFGSLIGGVQRVRHLSSWSFPTSGCGISLMNSSISSKLSVNTGPR